MDPLINQQARGPPKRTQISYACEACRISKIKCQPGPQSGICKRCSEFKRECVFRANPRTRRPRVSRPDTEAPPPPPGPSKTFSIEFTMPVDSNPHDAFDDLREKHERFISDLVPSSSEEEEEEENLTTTTTSQAFSFNDLSTPTPSAPSRPVSSLGIKPLFNLDSAAKLLASFRAMLPSCPCVVLPDDDVRAMARKTPFVLLAILAVTSCSTSLQGHSLYDEEFRKILGLKFVAGGERSVELLQGVLVYCAWYPFHLRPKNRQVLQYLRMAVDIVHDLELDEETDSNFTSQSPERVAERLQSIRAYLTCFYINSVHAWAWSKPYTLRYTSWLSKCCDTLEQTSDLEQDHILVWLVRLQYILNELEEADRINKKADAASTSSQSEHHRRLIRIGLETELRDFQTRIPGHISTRPSILMLSLIADIYLLAAPLIQVRITTTTTSSSSSSLDPVKLQAVTYTVRAFFDYATSLNEAQKACFSGVDTARFIHAVILAYRLSFPVPACPGYDCVQGRRVLDFGRVLARLSESGGGGGGDDAGTGGEGVGVGGDDAETRGKRKVDVVAALQVVLGSVQAKFERKSEGLQAAVAAAAEESTRRARGCPMFDGSLDAYLPLWEGQQSSGSMSSSCATFSSADSGLACPVGPAKPECFHDLWATMTVGWAAEADFGLRLGGDGDMVGFGVGNGGVDELVELGEL